MDRSAGSDDARADLPAATAEFLQRMTAAARRHLGEPLRPGLYLVATPIGNLGDMTVRALATLSRADLICCEDTRRSRILLNHFGIERPLNAYHDHNGERERPSLLRRLAGGERIALISDAGSPLIADPGFKLVREALELGFHVECLPGASAIIAALSVSGLPTDCFTFAGFLPSRSEARRRRIGELASLPTSLVLFETATRLAETLADLAALLGPRPAVVARELTKLHEERRAGTLGELAGTTGGLMGEIVIVVGPPAIAAPTDEAIRAALAEVLASLSLRDAVRTVAGELSASRSRVYDLAVAMQRGSQP
jgi:16S rRNA (cytidine1402-2'-O)-methyltransferase